MTLTTERLRELLDYNQETGVFTNSVTRRNGNTAVGTEAGSLCNGYRRIVVDGRRYAAHRLAWLYVNGVWPSGEIDHLNGEKHDNRIENLRDVNHATNMSNWTAAKSNNKSGLLGVHQSKTRPGRYAAKICVNGKKIYLGEFKSPEEARSAYLAARSTL